jgi:1,2-diacylglycerol 3-alpha-glucosyltransferase
MPDILKIFPNAHLQIVGNGEDYERLWYKIRERKLESKVELAGYSANDELRLRYGSCDIYISASQWDMFALPPLEAMACGRPVLLSNIPVHRELLEASHAGKEFSLENENDILNSISQVYDNRQYYSSNARQFALKYDWSVACERISRVYDQIITHH